jgi:hypothetical protein
VIISLSAGAARAGSRVKSFALLTGIDDGIAGYTGVRNAYNNLAFTPKFLVGAGMGAGHLAPSDLCWIGRENGGIVEIAKRNGIIEARLPFIKNLGTDGCKPGNLKDEQAWPIFNYAMAAIMEDALKCNPRSRSALADIQLKFPTGQVGEYAQQL